MRIYLKIIANSSQQKIKLLTNGNYKVWLKSIPEKNLANQELIKLLADYFKVNQLKIKIIVGKTSSRKIIGIEFFEN